MWRFVFVAVLWKAITSQPITDESENKRLSRQYDFVECCPCPGSRFDPLGAASFSRGQDVGQDFGHIPGLGAAVDECPCRFRNADPEGSPSMLFPSVVRPVRPIVRAEEPKEDPKPLLHPEVGLASSVLETLREATDEEYQDALARDAARNEARVSVLRDSVPDTAKNILTIIVNPKEGIQGDATPEASHAQETRVAPPLGSSKLGLLDFKKTPALRLKPALMDTNADMDSGASNVQEQVVGLSRGLEGLRLKTNPSVLKLLSTKKPEGRNIQSLLKQRGNEQGKDASDSTNVDNKQKSKIPTLKLPSWLRKDEISPLKPLNPGLNKFDVLKLKRPVLKSKTSRDDYMDSNTSPSVIQEQVSKTNVISSPFGIKSLLSKQDTKPPLSLEKILNLKDVELIKPKPISFPGFDKLLPTLRINASSDFNRRKKVGSKANKDCDGKTKVENTRKQAIKTEILDVLPAPSENTEVYLNNNDVDISTTENNINLPTTPKPIKIRTDILDTLPSASENDAITDITNNGNNGDEMTSGMQRVFEGNQAKTEILDALPSATGDHEIIMNTNQNTDVPQLEEFTNVNDALSEMSNESEADFNNESPKENIVNEESTGNDFDANLFNEPRREIDITNFDLDSQQVEFEVQDSVIQILNGNDGDIVENNEFINEEFENLESNEESSELFRKDSADNLKRDQDALTKATSQEEVLISLGNLQEKSDASSLEERFDESSFENTQKPEPQLDVSPIKKIISINLNKAGQLENVIVSNPKTTESELVKNDFEETEKNALSSDESADIDPLSEDMQQFPLNEKSVEEDSKLITNLQKNENSIREQQQPKLAKIDRNEKTQHDSDMQSSATNDYKTLVTPNERLVPTQSNTGLSDFDTNSSEEDVNRDVNTCPSHFEIHKTGSGEIIEKSIAHDSPDTEENEMAPEASESVFNTLSGRNALPNLREDEIPSSLFDESSSLPVQPLDISNLNLHIPTLDEIQAGISNLIRGNQKTAKEDNLSPEFASAEDCSDPTMSTDASTTRAKSTLPNLKSLEDINLDIFQINPLGKASPKIPALNLNSFKSKLALPKTFDLKPLKLESTLGAKNGGLFGASLTFGPDKIAKSHKAKSINKLGSILNQQGSDIFGNPLIGMPNLDELNSQMRANAKSLINSPLKPLEDTLRTTHTLGNSLRTHTENTMRNIQQTLASTLNEAKITDNSHVGGKFAKPEHLLDHLASAHEDMNDKLHAIHVDLQDRLSTIHDHIVDQSNLPKLQTPLLGNLGRFEESPLRSSINKEPSWVPKSPLPKSSNKKLIAAKKAAKTRKPNSKSKVTITSNTSRNNNEQKLKPFKMSKAASSLSPTRVEVPKLVTTSSKPLFSTPLQRDNSLKLKESNPFFASEATTSRPRSRIKPFGEFKVTISTTPPPASFRSKQASSRSQFGTNHPGIKKERPETPKRVPVTTGRSGLSDLRSFASEPKPTRTSAAARGTTPKPLKSSLEHRPNIASSRPKLGKSAIISGEPLKSPATKISPLTKLPLFKGLPSLSLPKTTESPLLAKVRDSIRIRINRPTHHTDKSSIGRPEPARSEDMTRSASETKEMVISAEPMRENVSYKCKMVCVRE